MTNIRANLPEELKAHILPFNWNVKNVWSLQQEQTLINRSKLDYLLALPLWSSIPGKGMLFDISPFEVISNSHLYQYQYQRLLKSDTKYPIDMLDFHNKLWILDGVHRLAKLYLQQDTLIHIRIHPESIMPHIKILINKFQESVYGHN